MDDVGFQNLFICEELLTGRHLWYISVWQCLFSECENLYSVCTRTCIRMLFDTRLAIRQNTSTTGCYFIVSFCTRHRAKKKSVYTSLLFYCIFCTSFSHIREINSSNFTERVFHEFKCIKYLNVFQWPVFNFNKFVSSTILRILMKMHKVILSTSLERKKKRKGRNEF